MWALVESNSVSKIYTRPTTITVGNVQYPLVSDLDKSISSELDYNIPITDRWSEQTGENLTEAGNYSQNAVAGQLFGTALFDNLTPLKQGQVNDAINTYGTTSQGFLSNK